MDVLATLDLGARLMELLRSAGNSFLEPLAIVGLLGQLCFFGRFLVQWLVSERRGRSVVPRVFWYMSLIGSVLVLVYAVLRGEGVIALGQTTGFVVYLRNLRLIARAGPTIAAP